MIARRLRYRDLVARGIVNNRETLKLDPEARLSAGSTDRPEYPHLE